MSRFRSKIVAIVAATALLVSMFAVAVPAAGVDGCEPYCWEEYTLYAGQTWEVGKVLVGNNADEVCVMYVLNNDIIADGFRITEIHLAVADALAEIPQTKTKNPIPGKFPVAEHFEDGVEVAGPYCFPRDADWTTDTMLYVAAHAVVSRVVADSFTPLVSWMRSAEPAAAHFLGYGAQWTKEQAFAIVPTESDVWDNGTYHTYSGPGTVPKFASWLYGVTAPIGGSYAGYSDLRRFQASFEIPAGYSITGARMYTDDTAGIPINDNLYVFVNGGDLAYWGGTRVFTGEVGLVFMDVTGVPAIREGSGPPYETDGWYIPGDMPELTGFESGPNVIDIFTEENERWGGMGKPTIELDYEMTESESAWSAGLGFAGKNWATYSMYEIKEPVFVETLSVSAKGTPTTSTALEADECYQLVASGTYRFANWGEYGIADAQFNYRNATYGVGGIPGWYEQASTRLQIWVDGSVVDWQPPTYNPEHVYTLELMGTGSPLVFTISDDQYSDNSGFITVEIYKYE